MKTIKIKSKKKVEKKKEIIDNEFEDALNLKVDDIKWLIINIFIINILVIYFKFIIYISFFNLLKIIKILKAYFNL